MKVFVIFMGYETIAGVFSTREKAEAYREQLRSKSKRHFSYYIEEYTIDVPVGAV